MNTLECKTAILYIKNWIAYYNKAVIENRFTQRERTVWIAQLNAMIALYNHLDTPHKFEMCDDKDVILELRYKDVSNVKA